MNVTIDRFCSCEMGTFGRLSVDGWECYTVERPWLDNRAHVSCIPPGEYRLALRPSGVVRRTSREAHRSGWEVRDVPGRSFIMFHVANSMDDLHGCIGMGDRLGVIGPRWAVLNSLPTFLKFMDLLPPSADHRLIITGDSQAL